MSSSKSRARICCSVGFSGSSGNFSSARSFCPRNDTSRLGRLGMGTASAGFLSRILERTRYFPKLLSAARCSQMLVGASFCLIFKSHTKFLTFVSEKVSSVTTFGAPLWAVGPLLVSIDRYFSSDFRYVSTVLSEYLRCVCRYIKKFWMYSFKSIFFYCFRKKK